MRAFALAAGTVAAAIVLMGFADEYSQLWGERGERWTPQSRLPDFSFAGYHNGEDPIPRIQEAGGVNVRDFGAKGDGQNDDTQAFVKAIEAIRKGVVFVPAGRYKITGILEIQKSNVVMRGAGTDKTTLFFPTPLNEIRPNWGATTTGERTSNYSWSGGFVWLRGDLGRQSLATISAEAKRGDAWVTVSTTEKLRAGQTIQIAERDNPDGSLASHLYSDDPGNTTKLRGRSRASLVSRIKSVQGNKVQLERALRFDVKPEWHATVLNFEPSVTESGVEDLRFEFPGEDYKGHFTELGFNPVALSGVAHCWVRNVRIANPDSGLFIGGVFNTVQGVVLESSRKPVRDGAGHHGIYIGGDDNVYTEFDYRMRFIHDISVSGCGGNVISDGKGVDLDFDHHKATPYENLFTNIDAGEGTRLWKCGGGADLGRQCAARGTFWNIRAKASLRYPPPGWGPASMNMVALGADQPSVTELSGKWFEAIRPERVSPRNIHKAQLSKRLGRRDSNLQPLR